MEFTSLVLNAGIDPNYQDPLFQSNDLYQCPLEIAVRLENFSAFKLLLRHGANPKYYGPLGNYVHSGLSEYVREFLGYSAIITETCEKREAQSLKREKHCR